MKTLIKFITIFILGFLIFGNINVYAEIKGLDNVQKVENITSHSIEINSSGTGVIKDDLQTIGFNILTIIKYIISGVLILFIVYTGVQMVMSMGSDEESLGKSKNQLWYTLVGLVFINIPGTLYNAFNANKDKSIDGTINGTWTSQISQKDQNLFINTDAFNQTLNGGIITFIEVTIFGIAILMIILSGIKIMISKGNEEEIKEGKNKIIWSLVGLIFIGFIETWQALVYNGKISDGTSLFQTIENLALFFAGPVAIFFLTLAGYYYITANGDDEKIKKAKSIIINTVIATVILMASHAFLKDLMTLTV